MPFPPQAPFILDPAHAELTEVKPTCIVEMRPTERSRCWVDRDGTLRSCTEIHAVNLCVPANLKK